MRHSQSNRQQVGGYTLIELLAVIAIITLLLGILLPAVQKIRAKGPQLQTRSEIGQIENAIESFKSTYDVGYLPSVFILANDYTNPALGDSRRYYSRLWPKASVNGITRTPAGTSVTLDGNQALVFFLGGIPPETQSALNPSGFSSAWSGGSYNNGTLSGFANSGTDPFNSSGSFGQAATPFASVRDGTVAKGPFFDFDKKRIDADGHYHDPHWRGKKEDVSGRNNWGENIYYYFSAKEGNDYRYFGQYNSLIPNITTAGGYGGVNPFFDQQDAFSNPIKYVNSGKYQIISAGADHIPGGGGLWPNPGVYGQGLPGGDDQSNFSGLLLGAGR